MRVELPVLAPEEDLLVSVPEVHGRFVVVHAVVELVLVVAALLQLPVDHLHEEQAKAFPAKEEEDGALKKNKTSH